MSKSGRIDSRALQRATAIGAVLQLVLVLLAHFNAWIAAPTWLFASMMVSATSGYLYAQDVAKGYELGVYGGTIVGGVCAAPALVISVALGDLPPAAFVVRALVYLLTGAVGGFFGQMAADWT
jgi:hypothetical protein